MTMLHALHHHLPAISPYATVLNVGLFCVAVLILAPFAVLHVKRTVDGTYAAWSKQEVSHDQ